MQQSEAGWGDDSAPVEALDQHDPLAVVGPVAREQRPDGVERRRVRGDFWDAQRVLDGLVEIVDVVIVRNDEALPLVGGVGTVEGMLLPGRGDEFSLLPPEERPDLVLDMPGEGDAQDAPVSAPG